MSYVLSSDHEEEAEANKKALKVVRPHTASTRKGGVRKSNSSHQSHTQPIRGTDPSEATDSSGNHETESRREGQ